MTKPWEKLASDQAIQKTAAALTSNGMTALVVNNGAEAKAKVLEQIPAGVEVMNMTSVTLDTIGLSEELRSERFNSVRRKLEQMNRAMQSAEMQRIGAAPEWVVGSVHAVTTDGHVLIASNTGSQLPAYASGAANVIWVVGAQKIVKDTAAGLQRIYEYTLPLESERARKAYHVPGSNVSKILIVNQEIKPGRVTVLIVKEVLGF